MLFRRQKKEKKKLGGIKTSCFWLADDSIKCEGFNSQMPLFSRYKGLWTEVHFFLQTDTKNKDHVLHTQKLTLSSIKYFQKTKPFPNCKKNITLKSSSELFHACRLQYIHKVLDKNWMFKIYNEAWYFPQSLACLFLVWHYC